MKNLILLSTALSAFSSVSYGATICGKIAVQSSNTAGGTFNSIAIMRSFTVTDTLTGKKFQLTPNPSQIALMSKFTQFSQQNATVFVKGSVGRSLSESVKLFNVSEIEVEAIACPSTNG